MSRSKYICSDIGQKRTYFGFQRLSSLKNTNLGQIIALVSIEDSLEVWLLDDDESMNDLLQMFHDKGEHVSRWMIVESTTISEPDDGTSQNTSQGEY